MALGHRGQVLVAGSTALLLGRGSWELRDLGVQLLRDVADPIVVYQVFAEGLDDEFPPLRAEVRTISLPARRDRLIGREAARVEVAALVADRRLVTLTGVGGTGKTRLAVEVARDLADGFEVTTFVDLSAVIADEQVVPASVTALEVGTRSGGPSIRQIVAHLGGRAALLVVDNAEHVLDAVAELVEAVLDACPSVRVLVTSREPLGVAGEVVWRVPSLDTPTAVALLEDRLGRSVDREVASELCRRLDGIPLAIELAAARARSLGVDEVLANLADRFRLLGGGRRARGRQATLHATLLWSHQLLTAPEQVLLRRLAVFIGGFTATAAETVCSPLDGPATRVALAALVDKSLVVYDDIAHRHGLLETVRLFAEEQLLEAGESTEVRARHVDWMLDLLGRQPSADHTSLLSFEAELPNVRAALEWLMAEGGYRDVIRLAERSRGLFWGALVERDLNAFVTEAAARCTEPLTRCEQVFVAFSTPGDEDPLAWVGRVEAVDPDITCPLTATIRTFQALMRIPFDPAGALAEVERLRALPVGLGPETAMLTHVITCQASYRLGRFDEAEAIYEALHGDRSSLYWYGPMLGLASMRIAAGKLDAAEALLDEIATDPYVNTRIGKIAFEAVVCELAVARGDPTAAGAALRRVEAIRDNRLSLYVAAEHQWFEAAAFLAASMDRIEDAAVLTNAAAATLFVETSPFITWTVERHHGDDPRWRRAINMAPTLDDARRAARALARSI
jgi:predicted ATPase